MFEGLFKKGKEENVSKVEATVKLDDIKVVLSKLVHELGEMQVKHTAPTELTIIHKVPTIRILVNTEPAPGVDMKGHDEELDISIQERRAARAEELNKILATQGEAIRAYRQKCWDEYLIADREGRKSEALMYKAKAEAIDDILTIK